MQFLLLLLLFFKLYIIVWVLPNIKMNLPQVYMCSPSWTLLPPPSPYHPSGPSQCISPKHSVLCIEPGLVTHFIYDIICFNAILPNHPPPPSPKHFFIHSSVDGHLGWFYLLAIVTTQDEHSCEDISSRCHCLLKEMWVEYPHGFGTVRVHISFWMDCHNA